MKTAAQNLVEVLRDERYEARDGRSMQREHDGTTPAGNPIGGRWVLRDADGVWIDLDQYRTDLAERNSLTFS